MRRRFMRWCVLPTLMVAAGITSPATVSAAPQPQAPCNLHTSDNALIIWTRWPGVSPFADVVGDVNYVHCVPTLQTWAAGEQTGPGYCAKFAWASDNPGYNAGERPAPPLKHVIDETGDC